MKTACPRPRAATRWYPIQVKQSDRTGRPEIDAFETAMRRDERRRGYFIALGFPPGR